MHRMKYYQFCLSASLLWSLVVRGTSGCLNGQQCHIIPFEKMRLVDHVIVSRLFPAHARCAHHCQLLSGCKSINFYVTSRTCELNNATGLEYPSDVDRSHGNVIYSDIANWPKNKYRLKEDPGNPCQADELFPNDPAWTSVMLSTNLRTTIPPQSTTTSLPSTTALPPSTTTLPSSTTTVTATTTSLPPTTTTTPPTTTYLPPPTTTILPPTTTTLPPTTTILPPPPPTTLPPSTTTIPPSTTTILPSTTTTLPPPTTTTLPPPTTTLPPPTTTILPLTTTILPPTTTTTLPPTTTTLPPSTTTLPPSTTTIPPPTTTLPPSTSTTLLPPTTTTLPQPTTTLPPSTTTTLPPPTTTLPPTTTTTLPPSITPTLPPPTTTTLPPTTTTLPPSTTTLPPSTTTIPPPTTTLPPSTSTTLLPPTTTTLPQTTSMSPTTSLPPSTTTLPPSTTTFPPTTTTLSTTTTTLPPSTTTLPPLTTTMPPSTTTSTSLVTTTAPCGDPPTIPNGDVTGSGLTRMVTCSVGSPVCMIQGTIYCSGGTWTTFDCLRTDIPRLCGGGVPNKGRLEIYYSGSWASVCIDHWYPVDVTVTCFSLGFSYGGSYHYAYAYGEGTGDSYRLKDLHCSGSEESLFDCYILEYTSSGCGHGNGIGLTCHTEPVTSNRVRIVDNNGNSGSGVLIGRPEIFFEGEWGTICGEGWNNNEGEAFCKTLNPAWTVASTCKDGCHGAGTGRIWTSDLLCDTTNNIFHCQNHGWGTLHDACLNSHSNDAGVECQP